MHLQRSYETVQRRCSVQSRTYTHNESSAALSYGKSLERTPQSISNSARADFTLRLLQHCCQLANDGKVPSHYEIVRMPWNGLRFSLIGIHYVKT